MRRATLVAITLVGFALRAHAIAAVTLRWDEGWSIALGTLPWSEMVRLTALDVHPPLYYAMLEPWLALGGAGEYWVRMASALASTAAVPLTAACAAAWWPAPLGIRRIAPPMAATLACVAPALIYYAGVARMYSLATFGLLVAAWGLGCVDRRWRFATAVAVPGALIALYSFYYSAFALAGLFLAALLAYRRQWRRTLGIAALATALYLPWLGFIAGPMLERLHTHTGASGLAWQQVPALVASGLCGALLCEPTGPWPIGLVLAALALGAVARPRSALRLSVAVLPVLAVLLGAAAGAQAHMFAARYVIVATPFLVLGLAWSVAATFSRWRALGVIAGASLALAALPAVRGYVYAKTAEVTGAYDPATDWRELHARANSADIAAFNILSLAGAYERYRTPSDPSWTYAQLWDPVHEPLDRAEARIARAVAQGARLWLVLYRGIAASDSAALKSWMDETYYPVGGWWNEGTWYVGYIGQATDRQVTPDASFGHGVRLVRAAYSSRSSPGGGIGAELEWRADARPDADARVFVHAYDATGQLVAQHDALPAADTRRPTTWAPGETITDRHGLWLPPGVTGPVTIAAGLYDPASGQRWTLPDGADKVVLGTVEVQ